MLPLCFVAGFLLPATQINPATNRKITTQNYCPLCQLGKLPSSRISTDILALRAQNLQQLSASLDQKPQSRTLCSLLPASQQSTENTTGSQPIPQCTTNTTVHRNSAHGKMQWFSSNTTGSAIQSAASIPAEWCTHSLLPHPLFFPADSRNYSTTTPPCPSSFVPPLIFFIISGFSGLLALHMPPFYNIFIDLLNCNSQVIKCGQQLIYYFVNCNYPLIKSYLIIFNHLSI
jgi:hypothetical protein